MHRQYYGSIIDGKELPAGRAAVMDSIDPATGEVLAHVQRADQAIVDEAVASSERAVPAWRDADGAERGRAMVRLADLIMQNMDLLAYLESVDNGKPLREAQGDVRLAAGYYAYYGGVADKIHGETVPLGPGFHSYTRVEPYGVTAHIVPWNAALQQTARGVAPAIAGGNTAVVKPAEDTSMAVVEFARLAIEAGIPPGVVNVVTGLGDEAGARLVQHPGVRRIAFTGSVPTGQSVLRASATHLSPVTLELGGKSPNIVFADADLDAAAVGSLAAINFNAGQVCMAGSRLLVHSSVHDEFVERLAALDRQVGLGRGLDNPDMGPITTEKQYRKILDYLEIGRAEGAEAVVGGGAAHVDGLESGRFVQPTVFVNVRNDMRIAKEEIFGPVLSVIPFDDEDEAVSIANDTPYGLTAGLWTTDLSRAHRVAARIDAGQVSVNNYFAGGIRTPFGGYKMSGFGREKGPDAVYHYLQTKTVSIQL
ncbi:aldehyde dehydrogenase family protein [Streptomyces hygroscopicus subsp. hygroscopicus]|uniref:Aldehyde dehydrogenase n=1 Tax=Streptomyces hygroscopicus TaxID=1912 RepID=A0ABQ3TQP1_STRHY|nr:aldehyde dehydrogenase family protein [Streptomyces hygroscopicus]MBW8092114.1 aldehyde dehydrogenase family protein [Streptomyces hygroscopicus subsp. hygroscopicus]GHJ25651.1 aldehyde dehydrogenase [Streptomyces hygroscopicus]